MGGRNGLLPRFFMPRRKLGEIVRLWMRTQKSLFPSEISIVAEMCETFISGRWRGSIRMCFAPGPLRAGQGEEDEFLWSGSKAYLNIAAQLSSHARTLSCWRPGLTFGHRGPDLCHQFCVSRHHSLMEMTRPPLLPHLSYTHTRARARAHAHTHVRTRIPPSPTHTHAHANTHTHTHTHSHTHAHTHTLAGMNSVPSKNIPFGA